MSANYDVIISRAPSLNLMNVLLTDFLSGRGLNVTSIDQLDTVDITGHNAILLSQPNSGWLQILPGSEIRIDTTWYASNPLGGYLSSKVESSIHIWSLDSGRVAGYAIYSGGKKSDCQCVFSKYSKNTAELMDGVPVPEDHRGTMLSLLAHIDHDFSGFMARYDSLEIGVGELIARFGFEVHLVDYYDATDEKQGSAIERGKHRPVQLLGWTAIMFAPK
jgi:hypothetical protein